MWVAGLRAMYLQALHPRTMRATWQNTAFARPGEAWGRFARTVEFVRVRTYGTRAEVERAGRRVRHIHATVTGTDVDGSVIRLNEPELLLWVHCGEIASYVNIAQRCGLGLSAGDLDAFVDEQRRSAEVVGLNPVEVPGSAAELEEYYERMRPSLYVCAEARQAMVRSFVPDIPWPFTGLRLVVPPMNALGFASLPRWARRMYGTPGTAGHRSDHHDHAGNHAPSHGQNSQAILGPAAGAAGGLAADGLGTGGLAAGGPGGWWPELVRRNR